VRIYFDTSALCRYYHTEPGSLAVEQLVADVGNTHYVSWLTVLEAQSAFAMKVRTGEITAADWTLLRKRLKADIVTRRWLVVRVLRRHFDRAENLLATFATTRRLRSLDALHLGTALDLLTQKQIDAIVTADSAMEDVTRAEGLAVINPLSS
jgi:predicted nucleic acid-binding protein